MIRELLTKLSKAKRDFSESLDNLGTLGKVVGFVLGFLILFGAPLPLFLIAQKVFPNFWTYASIEIQSMVLVFIMTISWGLFYWVESLEAKDYVSHKIYRDVQNNISNLNEVLRKLTNNRICVRIEFVEDIGNPYLYIDFPNPNEMHLNIDLRVEALTLVQNINECLSRAHKRGAIISFSTERWPHKDNEDTSSSELYLYWINAELEKE